jgi:hypothetical protein
MGVPPSIRAIGRAKSAGKDRKDFRTDQGTDRLGQDQAARLREGQSGLHIGRRGLQPDPHPQAVGSRPVTLGTSNHPNTLNLCPEAASL